MGHKKTTHKLILKRRKMFHKLVKSIKNQSRKKNNRCCFMDIISKFQ